MSGGPSKNPGGIVLPEGMLVTPENCPDWKNPGGIVAPKGVLACPEEPDASMRPMGEPSSSSSSSISPM